MSDLLEQSPRELSRTAKRVLAGVAALAVGAYAVDLVADRRREAEVVRLEAAAGDVGLEVRYDPRSAEAVERLSLVVRNLGPRSVDVTSARAGDYASTAALEDLPAGEPGTLLLERRTPCAELPGQAPPQRLQLDVGTARGPRTAEVDLPPSSGVALTGAADRACGQIPAAQALRLEEVGSRRDGERVVLRLALGNASTAPLLLLQAAVQSGLGGELLDLDGTPLRLPLPLPPTTPGDTIELVLVDLAVQVVKCDEVDRAPAPTTDVPSLRTISVTLQDPDGVLVGPVDRTASGAVRALVTDRC